MSAPTPPDFGTCPVCRRRNLGITKEGDVRVHKPPATRSQFLTALNCPGSSRPPAVSDHPPPVDA